MPEPGSESPQIRALARRVSSFYELIKKGEYERALEFRSDWKELDADERKEEIKHFGESARNMVLQTCEITEIRIVDNLARVLMTLGSTVKWGESKGEQFKGQQADYWKITDDTWYYLDGYLPSFKPDWWNPDLAVRVPVPSEEATPTIIDITPQE